MHLVGLLIYTLQYEARRIQRQIKFLGFVQAIRHESNVILVAYKNLARLDKDRRASSPNNALSNENDAES